MLSLRYARAWRIAGFLLLMVVLAAALLPQHSPKPLLSISDKWLHGVTFTALALWFSGQYPRHNYWRLVVGLLAFGMLIELAQSMVPYRAAESMDLMADVVGVAAGITIALAGSGGWSLRFEQWLQNRIG